MAENPTDLPPLSVAPRLDALRARFAEAEVDALVVTTLPNVRYLTGFSGSAAVLTVTADEAVLMTDGRYRTRSAEEVAEAGAADAVRIVIGGVAAQREAVQQAVKSAGASRVGLEADNVTWEASRNWGTLLEGSALVPTTRVVEALREVKDDAEIARMQRAAAIADAALGEVLPLLSSAGRAVVTEAEFALALDTAMRRRGAEGVAFETIVAAGPNSAKPHHQPSDRRIEPGDPVVVDFGALYEGYRSDMTRTFCVGGEPEGELAAVFDVVRRSQAQGVSAVKAGVGAKDVDEVCRAVITEAGWGEKFEHGTGHGVGLDIHEAPTVSPLGTAILAPGFIVTVEPGVYLPGVGGVRIEDTLVVTADGSRPLTTFTKDVVA